MTQKDKTKTHSKLPFLFLFFLIVTGVFVYKNYSQIADFLGVKHDISKASDEMKDSDGVNVGKDAFLGPYEDELEDYLMDEVNKEIVQTLEVKVIKKYRLHLVHMANLSSKFLEDKDYSAELSFLLKNNSDYNNKVIQSLEKLGVFNKKYHKQNIEEYIKLENKSKGFLKRIFARIFDVMSENPEYKNMLQERENLKEDLKIIQSFIYSPEFLKKHINYD
jgi:hypothetical protein